MSKKQKGERYDGYLAKQKDSMHIFMPYMLGSRVENEAVMNESIDLTAVNAYIAEKNSKSPEFKYTLFHVISAAIAKTIQMRPLMNRFIMGGKYYDRKWISLAFTAKKQFSDKAEEALVICKMKDNTPPINQIREQIEKQINAIRKENKNDGATDIMDTIVKLPPFGIRLTVKMLKFLDRHGWLPKDVVNADPYHASVFVSNLGSIKLHATYHHLADWGTNSFFVVIGEKYKKLKIMDDNSTEVREFLDLGITVDERIADGYYYAKTVRVLRAILEDPYLLEKPLDYEIIAERKEVSNATDKSPMA